VSGGPAGRPGKTGSPGSIPTPSRSASAESPADDLDHGVAFWSAALDAKEEPLSEASSQVCRRLRLPDSDIRNLLQRTADPKTRKERMHLDLESNDVEAEVRRLEALGATRYDHQQERGYDFWVLRDPWANEFCVLQINFPDLLAARPPWAR
jgi:hypothetical protein